MNGFRASPVSLNKGGMTSKSRLFIGTEPSDITFFPVPPCRLRAAVSRPPKQYEFATGSNVYFGAERFAVGEQFFSHSRELIVSRSRPPETETINLLKSTSGNQSQSSKKHTAIDQRVAARL